MVHRIRGGIIPPPYDVFFGAPKSFLKNSFANGYIYCNLLWICGRFKIGLLVLRGGRVAKRLRRSFLKKADNSWYFLHCLLLNHVCRKMFVLSTVLGVLRLDNIEAMPAVCLLGS